MYFHSTKPTSSERRGVILLVVLLMLTIFATLGLTLVLMTESYANSSRVQRESENMTRPDVNPELAFALFMGQFLYDVDDATGPNSALRGHSLARTQYSWDSNTVCDRPYSGWGRLRGPTGAVPSLDEFDAVNYQQFTGLPAHDPERMGWHAAGGAPGKYVGGFNAGYTYPDENNMFLGYVKQTANGSTVVIPSYHRPWLMQPDPLTKVNPWMAGYTPGRYKTLRPRSADMGMGPTGLPLFPTDAEDPNNYLNPNPNYDVKNLDGFPGGADSVWIDVGAPIMTTPDGVKYKMLYAPLILELDSRINLNVHGNVLGNYTDPNNNKLKIHASNQGWGPWEVNISKILSLVENQSLFYGSPIGNGLQFPTTGESHVLGRYTNPTSRTPLGNPLLAGLASNGYGLPMIGTPGNAIKYAGTSNRIWAALDWDAMIDVTTGPPPGAAAGYVTASSVPMPEGGGSYWFSALPGYSVSNIYRNGVTLESSSHPALYNPLVPSPGNQNIPLQSLVDLLRFNGTNYEFIQSDLLRLAQNTLLAPVSASIASASEQTINNPPNPTQGLVTMSTTTAHGFVPGQNVTITGVGGALSGGYNGRFTILASPQPTANTFYYYNPTYGLNSVGTGGTVTNLARQQLTLLSNDLARPGAMPYFWGDPTQTQYQYTQTFSQQNNPPNTTAKDYSEQPSGQSIPFPTPTQLSGGKPPGSEFQATTILPQVAPNLASLARALRVDLNRTLTSYYNLKNVGGKLVSVFNSANYPQATLDRQNFAMDLFSALRLATGARDPNDLTLNPPMSPSELTAARSLAQLAVNIVDYIDQDDINTPFAWITNNPKYSPATQWVFGTELPRLVINEVYSQLDNDGTNQKGNWYQNVWVELFNPLTPESDPSLQYNPQDVSAQLVVTPAAGQPINAYRLLVTQQVKATDQATILDFLRNPSNTDGPDTTSQGGVGTNFSTWFSVVSGLATSGGDFPTQTVNPLPGYQSFNDSTNTNSGFLVIGSNFDYSKGTPADNPKIPVYKPIPPANASGAISKLKISVNNPPSSTAPTSSPQPVMTILQRLACPQMPLQTNNAKANYNPYITVDFLPGVPTFDTRATTTNGSPVSTPVTNTGQNQPGSTPAPTVPNRHSYGKRQPYSSFVQLDKNIQINDVELPPKYTPAATPKSQVAIQSPLTPVPPPVPPPPTQIQHTFYAQNSLEYTTPNQPPKMPLDPTTTNKGVIQTLGRLTGGTPAVQFDWLVHLDRQPISPMELLTVSGYKPAMLTQQFVAKNSAGNISPHQQVAPWLNEPSRLYRFFEFAQTGPRMNGLSPSGRIPGEVNINMVFEPEIFDALVDGQAFAYANAFTQGQAEALFTAILASRNKYTPGGAFPQGPSTQADRVRGSNGDRPFWSFGVGPADNSKVADSLTFMNANPLMNANRGIENTLLRSTGYYTSNSPNATNQRLFDPYGIPIASSANNGAKEAGNTVTITTAIPHGLTAGTSGQIVGISGVTTTAYNGTFTVASVPSSTTLTYLNPTASGQGTSGSGWVSLIQNTQTAPGNLTVTGMNGTAGNPHVRYELLNKLYNNVTTRSNTFAVWVTVGFFEVVDPTTTPPKLGAEVGKAEGRSIRHRMFSIVDRTNMQMFNSTNAAAITIPNNPLPPPTSVKARVRLGAITSNLSPLYPPPKLQPGMTLVYEPNTPNEETVVVQTGNQATFYKNHANGVAVLCRGNPGPQKFYDPHMDPDVVRFFAVIE